MTSRREDRVRRDVGDHRAEEVILLPGEVGLRDDRRVQVARENLLHLPGGAFGEQQLASFATKYL